MIRIAPERMTGEQIRAEVGEILAAGAQRLGANNIKSPTGRRNCSEHLDVDGDSEAPCRTTTELPE